MIDRLVLLGERLRQAGIDVSTSEVIDAGRTIEQLDLDLVDRRLLRECLRAAMVKEPDPAQLFDRCFDSVFRVGTSASVSRSEAPAAVAAATGPASGADAAVLSALLSGDEGTLAALAEQAVAMFSGIDNESGSERYFMHRVLRAMDLSRMLSAAMQQLRREGDIGDLELMLRRNEIAQRIEQFRRQLASEISKRLDARADDGSGEPVIIPERVKPDELDLLQLSRSEQEEVRRMLQPLLRRLAARIGQKRKLRSTGRLDPRRTVRRSLQSGGVPIDVVMRRRHPHRPDVVVLCDVSGSVAEFAQFTFTLINALHEEVRKVRSFAFVDGVAEVTDVFAEARFDIAVNRLVERRGVVGLDGHSDYGAAFTQFHDQHLDDAIGAGTTLIVTGDARGNYRDSAAEQFARIAERARRVYWLNPEPRVVWGTDDSLIEEYRRSCTAIREVRTLGQLADVIAELV
ncbi:MAG: VWA domain-containing protein [Ilumatobacteraceae bacterium]